MDIQIKDSYKVTKKKEMVEILSTLEIKRTIKSMVREWRSHNLLYSLHLFRSHTKDVDFEENIKWYYSLCWFILSPFYSLIP